MSGSNRQRVLVVSRNSDIRNELVTLLSGYGYFVEYCQGRMEGMRKFRAHKQPIIILDLGSMRMYPLRMFQFIKRIRKNTIVLIAASKKEESEAFDRLALGAYDVLSMPFKTESLKLTLNRALEHHRVMLENIFVKNVMFFTLLMAPLWALLGYLIVR